MPSIKDAYLRSNLVDLKKPASVEVDSINDIIFTGTGLHYLQDTIKKRGIFAHEKATKVFLTNMAGGAYSAAINRSRSHKDVPVILIVNSKYEDSTFNPRREGIQKDIVCELIPLKAIIKAVRADSLKESDFVGGGEGLSILDRCEEVIINYDI